MNDASTHQGNDPVRDDRKSAAFAARYVRTPAGSKTLTTFSSLRDVFRSPDQRQGMPGAEGFITGGNQDHTPINFLDGEPHRRRRNAIARYFTPKAITTRYYDVMRCASEMLMEELQREGSAVLDVISFQMAVDVTAEVVGLTNSNNRKQAVRLRKMLDNGVHSRLAWPALLFRRLTLALRMQDFYRKDVAPAIEARKTEPREDVITHMMKENYSKRSMLIECMIYGIAGMVTTRELITMAAWHMLENEPLRQRYINGSDDEQFAIIEEILRLEPVAGMLYRIMPKDSELNGSHASDEMVCLDIRSANMDESVTGPCPHILDPDRAKRMKESGSWMSFGDGPHRCPGAQLALHETRIFLDKLLRLPGIRLQKPPTVRWNTTIMGYELRDGIVACDRVAGAAAA